MPEKRRVVVVGGGPSGLTAAIAASERGAAVTVLERMGQAGAKLLATGGGRCNVTNTLDAAAFLERFGRSGRFMRKAVYAFDSQALTQFLSGMGVATQCADGFHVFPASGSAKEVRDAVVARCGRLGVALRTGVETSRLIVEDDRVCGVETSRGDVRSDHVILAAGGCAWPALGSNGSGFALAREAGHVIVPPAPALVPLVTREEWPRACAGISMRGARVRVDRRGASREGATGDLLFTHRGISGPAVLDLSREASRVLAEGAQSVGVFLHLTDESNPEVWKERIVSWVRQNPRRLVRKMVAQAVPERLAEAWCRGAGVSHDTQLAHLPREGARQLAAMLAGARVEVVGTEGLGKAMVTSGGVATGEVDPATLGSRLIRGLSFAGEVLDIDGPCGGYNLQWAFSSGMLAGSMAAAGGDGG